MDNKILDILTAIRDTYGDGVFYNNSVVRNLLSDLTPALNKERIQISNFLETNGYFQLKHAQKAYPLIRSRLITNYSATYAVDETIAAWVVDIFGALLGYTEIRSGAEYKREHKPVPPIVPPEPAKPDIFAPIIPTVAKPATPPPLPAAQPKQAVKPLAAGPLDVRPPDVRPLDYTIRIAADFHTVAVNKNGQTLTAGFNEDGQCNTWWWRDIVEVSTGTHFTIGLKSDGTVMSTGRNDHGQLNVRHWQDIVQISAGMRHTAGLRKDGSVFATGDNTHGECNVSKWRYVKKVIAGCQCTFGIKKDGRVLFAGDNWDGALRVLPLNNVANIECPMSYRAMVLHTDGTSRWIGEQDSGHRPARYKNLKQISAAPDYFAGLFNDGTVRLLTYFWQDTGVECAAHDWRDIKAISAGRYHIAGVKNDGHVLAAMIHPDAERNRGQCNVEGWEI